MDAKPIPKIQTAGVRIALVLMLLASACKVGYAETLHISVPGGKTLNAAILGKNSIIYRL